MIAKAEQDRIVGMLEDGHYILIPGWAKDKFVGMDEYYNPIIRDSITGVGDEELFAISSCCGAHGKGSENAIVCRNCYQEVDGLGYELRESAIFIKASPSKESWLAKQHTCDSEDPSGCSYGKV